MPLLIVIPQQYPYTLMGLAAHFTLMNFIPLFVIPVKKRVYSPEHMKQYEIEHQQEFGPESSVAQFGLPDQGTGWYSKDLPYKDWIDIQAGMRVPMNYIEQIPLLVFLASISGLYYPFATMILVWVALIGRILYTIGYMKESKFRIPGFLIALICVLGLMGMSIITSLVYIQGFK